MCIYIHTHTQNIHRFSLLLLKVKREALCYILLLPLSDASWRFSVSLYIDQGLPMWRSHNEPTCQCRRHGFDPWVGKIPWRRKWQPTPIFLPGRSHRLRSLAGYSLWGRKESDTTAYTCTHAYLDHPVRAWPTSSPMGLTVNVPGFPGPLVSVATTQLCL